MATHFASRPEAEPRPGGPGLRRRMATDMVGTGVLWLATALTVGVLLWVLGYAAVQGFRYLGPEFLTSTPPGDPSRAGGGFLNGIIGSLIVVGLATVVAVPLGVGAAVYVVEYGGRLARAVDFLTDLLIGIPAIVTGAFVYALWVTRFGFSGYAGAISLALVMLPLIVRATAEILCLVPRDLREAGLALGVTPARTIVSVVLPTAMGGITTGIMLAVARAMGETAPLLLTALGNDLFVETHPDHRMSTLSLQIFSNAITGFEAAQARAWAGALTLVILVLLCTAVARFVARRSSVTGAR
ncbi:phosphate ABC transporter permease PstA [Streptomyces lacrimifluminis]|uniref:Phosphate transport system permease protein PstA n=1 Tax=Streptomyces lacrimifluminis TaxID=1500077 RepID=A0A917KWB6_9ACTN|nr:phosphate ABC transporter permease PstA [Streptomyces lacrimifluminis]GGJ32863.1 phosphate transport system permease protein PstA [Streptomyces lacrimifluminis]